MDNLKEYLDLESQYFNVHKLGGTEADEDRILDLMDVVWVRLTQDEKDRVNDRVKQFVNQAPDEKEEQLVRDWGHTPVYGLEGKDHDEWIERLGKEDE